MNRTLTITLMVAMSSLLSIGAHANSKMEHRLKLLEMLERAEFQEAIEDADACTRKRDFKCARKRISEAEELASTSGQYEVLKISRDLLDGEEKLVTLAKEEQALKERMRRERIAEEKRQREWQAEQRRQREIAERRAREKRDKQQAASLLIGLGAGYAAIEHGADSELAEQIFDQTSTGAYAVMSGDQEAARKYQQLQSNMQQNLDDFQVRQERLRREQAERRRQHQEIIDRHEAHMRANENKPVYASQQRIPDTSASGQEHSSSQGGSTDYRAAVAEQERQKRAREKQEYEANKMAQVDVARQKFAEQNRRAPEVISSRGTSAGTGGELKSLSGYVFELPRYEPAGNGFVLADIRLEGWCRPDVPRNAPGTNGRFVKCGLSLSNDVKVVGYKYKGQVYPHQPSSDGRRIPWPGGHVRVSGGIYEGRTKVESFQSVLVGPISGAEVGSGFQASADQFNKGDFEFRDMKLVPVEYEGNHKVIQSYLDKIH